MKNILFVLIVVFTLSCNQTDQKKSVEEIVENMEIKFQERHKQVLEDRKNYMLYGNFVRRSSSYTCSSSEQEEEWSLILYMLEVKKMSMNQANLYRNCMDRIMTQEGMEKLVDSKEEVERHIAKMMVDDVKPIFPHTIKDFSQFTTFTSKIFTYEQFTGFLGNPENGYTPVRIVQPDGVEVELTSEEIIEYSLVLAQIVKEDFFVEDVDFYYQWQVHHLNKGKNSNKDGTKLQN